MSEIDFVIVATSETVRYEQYSDMPLDRIDLYRNLVQLRMVYYDGGFRSHLDLINKVLYGKYFYESTYPEKRSMLNIWNLPALNAVLAINPLVHNGFNCKIINNFDAEFDILCDYCNQMDRLIIGVSTTFILQWSEVGRICKKIHKHIPDAIIVLGGAFIYDQFVNNGATHFEKKMRKYGIKYTLFSHNSENDLLALVTFLKANESNLEINNVAYLDSENIFRVNNYNWNPTQVDILPIHWNLLNINTSSKTIQLRTSSGCPFQCAFCNYSTTAKNFICSDISQIREQLDTIKQIDGIENIVFVDDNLNVPKKRFRQIIELLKQYNFRWYAFLRVQFVDEQIAHEMKLSGCDGVYLGLESGNDGILQNMNKKAKIRDYKNGISSLKKNNIKTFASFIIGFPGETEETINDTISFIDGSGLDFFSLKEFYYLPTAPIHSHCNEFSLEGEGNIWSHNTMNSTQASEMKFSMFAHIRKSIHIDPDLGLWQLIYLRDRGFSWDQIIYVHKIINEMIHRDNAGQWLDKSDLFEILQDKLINVANNGSLDRIA